MGLGETFSELLKPKIVGKGKTGGDLISLICENKSIIILYLEELKYKQIAEITGLTENHIAVKIQFIFLLIYSCLLKTCRYIKITQSL